jgi:carnitine O-acetyltransferase
VQLHREANERPAPFVDHAGILRDSKTGRPINGYASDNDDDEPAPMGTFFFVLLFELIHECHPTSSWLFLL